MSKDPLAIDLDTVVVAAPSQISADLGDGVVLLELGSETYFSLNEVAARIWDLIAEPRAIGQIRDAVLSEFDVDPETCERETLRLVGELRAAGLAEIASPPR